MDARSQNRRVLTDVLGIGHDLVLDGRDTFEQLRSGLSRRYQLHFVRHAIFGLERLNLDDLHCGLLGFEGTPGSNARWENHPGGLTVAFDRPADAVDQTSVSQFAAINVAPTLFNYPNGQPDRFLLFGTFRHPIQQPLNGFVDGDWAAAMLLESSVGRAGISCQFKTTGTRMNLPGTMSGVSRPNLPSSAVARITDSENPSTFTLILAYNRKAQNTGFACLLVDQEFVDSVPFGFQALDNQTPQIKTDKVLIGVGSVTGKGFTAKVDLIDIQIWLPTYPTF